MRNAELARCLRDLAVYLEMDGVPFKPRAYEKAAQAVEAHAEPLDQIHLRGGVQAIGKHVAGVGASIAATLGELLTTGRARKLDDFRRRMPVDIAGLLAVEGIGPKAVKVLFEELGVQTLDDLEAAVQSRRVRALPHFGAKSEERIARSLAFVRGERGRRTLAEVQPVVDELVAALAKTPGVTTLTVAGSIRRRRETIGDVDLLAVARDAARLMRAFVALSQVGRVLGHGDTKASVKLGDGLQVDLRVVPAEAFGAALLYFTGSKDHNVALRQIALRRNLKLNEYGLFRGTRRIAGGTEVEVYERLGLGWVPPELREDRGEIERARTRTLPRLIEAGDLRGDLQIQTDWSDGRDSIQAMAQAARALGLEYIAIIDHTAGLAMTGADAPKLRRQMQAIAALNDTLSSFRVLSGAEVNIGRDGTLDVDDETLAHLDVVGIAVHSHFDLPRREQTERLVRAMRNPHADVLFHPTARKIQKREGLDVDIGAIVRAARETGTVLELDAFPDRLDLRDEHLRMAVDAGVPLVIDSDAHDTAQLEFVRRHGVDQARRGWVEPDHVLNTRPLPGLLAALKDGRHGPPARRAGSRRAGRPQGARR